MCTLTVIPWSSAQQSAPGIRVECNRDESRLRAPALPPQERQFGRQRGVMPVDPSSNGTWIGANEAALVAVLMNVYVQQALVPIESPRGVPVVSRGRIIPHVLSAGSLSEALALAEALDQRQFEPYRLILVDRTHHAVLTWSAGQLQIVPETPLEAPLFFTSSGLGDELVATPRRRLFDAMFAGDKSGWPQTQDAFHRQVTPGHEFASVWMTRADARTVSVTTVELDEQFLRMDYLARSDEQTTTQSVPLELPLS